MYGHIHIILKDLVLSVAGTAAWQRILEEAGISSPGQEAEALDTVVQPDEVTTGLVGATCKVLGLTVDTALHTFGKHFVVFALRSGNAAFLKSQGATLHAFLQNVNQMHTYLERDHPDARFPFLESTYLPETDTALLVYLSSRPGLASLLIGVVEEIGRRLYGLDVTFEAADVPKDLLGEQLANRAAAWHVVWRNRPGGPQPLEPHVIADEVRQVAFPELHAGLVDFVSIVREARFLPGCGSSGKDKLMDSNTRVARNGCSHLCFSRSDAAEEELVVGAAPHAPCSTLRAPARTIEVHLAGGASGRFSLRAARAEKIAAAWSDCTLRCCRIFWESAQGRAQDYSLSEDAVHVDAFVSHSWAAPENWRLVLGDGIDYADIKSTTLAVVAKDLALRLHKLKQWGRVTFWVDKACIPQEDQGLKTASISVLEKFISHCDSVCVLFTWSYLERLWCVFEWACLLLQKEPRKVVLANEHFVTEASLPLYIQAVRYFSLKRTRCSIEADREVLERKIDKTYVSRKAFESLVKASAAAFMARSMAFRAGRSTSLHARFFTPWVTLAAELQFHELAAALDTCRADEWRKVAMPAEFASREAAEASTHRAISVSASKYQEQISMWFDEKVAPVLHRLRADAVACN